jgi:hypothetical protein
MSAPDFDGTPMTKREVLIARAASNNAIDWLLASAPELTWHRARGREYAEQRYPLPKVTRPRVVRDRFGEKWRVAPESGETHLEWQDRNNDTRWEKKLGNLVVTFDRVALWADLLANPTEEVEA